MGSTTSMASRSPSIGDLCSMGRVCVYTCCTFFVESFSVGLDYTSEAVMMVGRTFQSNLLVYIAPVRHCWWLRERRPFGQE